MAFQLLGAILFGAFGGQWIDNKMGNPKPYATIIGSLIGIISGLYISLKDFFHSSKDKTDDDK
jgi:F0F1-type ATP synthase assembly protein I